MSSPPRSSPDRDRIREVFLKPRAIYAVDEAAALLRMPVQLVENAIAEGAVTSVPLDGGLGLPWADVVVLGMEHRWTYGMLTDALRGRNVPSLPPLVRGVAGRIVLPAYQWKLLRLLSARRARDERRHFTTSDLIEEAIMTAILTTIDDWRGLESAHPGIHAAAEWPAGS